MKMPAEPVPEIISDRFTTGLKKDRSDSPKNLDFSSDLEDVDEKEASNSMESVKQFPDKTNSTKKSDKKKSTDSDGTKLFFGKFVDRRKRRKSETVSQLLKETENQKLDFLAVESENEEWREHLAIKNSISLPDFTGLVNTKLLNTTDFDWGDRSMAVISDWIRPDHSDQTIGEQSLKALRLELDACSGTVRTVLYFLRSKRVANAARELAKFVQDQNGRSSSMFTNVLIVVPLTAVGDLEHDSWEWWHTFRTLAGNAIQIEVCLQIVKSTPKLKKDEPALKRWLGESIGAIWVDTSLFKSYGEECLEFKQVFQRNLLRKLFSAGYDTIRVILAGNEDSDPNAFEKHLAALRKYWKGRFENRYDEWGWGGRKDRDCIYYPLKPLSDNLDSGTYELFEWDSQKYFKYKQSIYSVMSAFVFTQVEKPIIMVLGSGRGPLVNLVYSCAKQLRANWFHFCPKIYAVEKNLAAVVTLSYRNQKEWNDSVTIVQCDMRNFQPEEKADLVVSELLGGFSDNELSPECLDGAMHLMKKTCISIPKWYRSLLSPIQSTRLVHNKMVHAMHKKQREGGSEMSDQVWVSRLFHRYDIYDGLPKEVFRFSHPKFDEGNDKYGFRQLSFRAKVSCELMGFAGFMDCCLDEGPKGNFLSTIPAWHTAEMYSWFPAFFPLIRAVKVNADEDIILNFWRLRDNSKVWYEWNLEKPVCLPIQNSGGIGFSMPLK